MNEPPPISVPSHTMSGPALPGATSPDHRLVIDRGELAQYAPHDRQQMLTLVRRIDWLTERIYVRATMGQPIHHMRIERKATRWALEQLGLTLSPNPPIPESHAPAAVTGAPITSDEGGPQ
jgi:hypothetical protein